MIFARQSPLVSIDLKDLYVGLSVQYNVWQFESENISILSSGLRVKRCSCTQMKHFPPFFLYHRSSIVAFLTMIPSFLHESSAAVAIKGAALGRIMRAVVRTQEYKGLNIN
jgi:hypothetical protein